MSSMVLLNATQIRPSDSWLASSLMFADRVSTLTVPGKGCPFPVLQELDMWQPANLGDLSLDKADELINDIEALNEQHQFVQSTNKTRPMRLQNNFIYQEKFPTHLQDSLINSEHLVNQVDDDGRSRLVGNQDFIDAVLNLAGGSLAKVKEKDGWTLAVRNKTEAVINLAPMPHKARTASSDSGKGYESENPNAIGQSLEIPFPVLAPGVTLKDVLEFREKYKKQFVAFHASLTRITREALTESSMRDWFNEYLSAIEEMTSNASSSRLNLKIELRNFIRTLKPTDNWAGKNLSITQRATLLAVDASAAYEGMQMISDISNLDIITITATGLSLSLHLVEIRQSAPNSYLKKAITKGLIA